MPSCLLHLQPKKIFSHLIDTNLLSELISPLQMFSILSFSRVDYLPNKNILDWSKSKTSREDKLSISQKLKFAFRWVKTKELRSICKVPEVSTVNVILELCFLSCTFVMGFSLGPKLFCLGHHHNAY